MRRAAVVALVLAACASRPAGPRGEEESRAKDDEALAARAAEIAGAADAKRWVVVQRGEIAAGASFPDDAVRAAKSKAADVAHRYVFRPADRGDRLFRMAYVAQGGVVVGRVFLENLGLEAVGVAGRPPLLRRKGAGGGIDLAKTPRLPLDLTTLDDATRISVDAAYDPDFDGGLLVPRELAASLALPLYEIPGAAEVQVALGRPFRARRATVLAKVPGLGPRGPVEVVFEAMSTKR